jgi:hypothetical protein
MYASTSRCSDSGVLFKYPGGVFNPSGSMMMASLRSPSRPARPLSYA